MAVSWDNIVGAKTLADGGRVGDLLEIAFAHLEKVRDEGQISDAILGEVYASTISNAFNAANAFELQAANTEAQTLLTEAQKNELLLNGAQDRANKVKQGLQLDAQTATEVQKALLVTRQTKGFDDDAIQKLLKQTLDSWSVAYSVAQDENSIPDTIKVNSIDSVMKNAMDNLSIVVSNDPIGEP